MSSTVKSKADENGSINTYQRYLNGALSGLVEVTSTHWVDVLKTRLQAEKDINPKVSTLKLISTIRRKEGFRGFYRGYISRMCGVGPMRAVFWGTMDTVNHHLKDNNSLTVSSKLLISGVIGGAAQSLVDVPIEVAKTKLITSHTIPLNEVIKESLKFRGAGSTLTRNMIFAAIMNFGLNYKRDSSTTSGETILRAGCSAIVASTLTQPLDFVKTQQQKVGGFHNVNFIKLLIDTGRKSTPLLFTGLMSRASLSIATMSVSATMFMLLASIQGNKKPKQ